MNKERRKMISVIISNIQDIKERLDDILLDEQDYYDNIPENLLSSERAEISEEAIDILEEVADNIEDIIDNLSEVI